MAESVPSMQQLSNYETDLENLSNYQYLGTVEFGSEGDAGGEDDEQHRGFKGRPTVKEEKSGK